MSNLYLKQIEILDDTKPLVIRPCHKRKVYLKKQNVKEGGYVNFQQVACLLSKGIKIFVEGPDEKKKEEVCRMVLEKSLMSLIRKRLSEKSNDEILKLIEAFSLGKEFEKGDPIDALFGVSEKPMRCRPHSNQRLRWKKHSRKSNAALPRASHSTASYWLQDFCPKVSAAD